MENKNCLNCRKELTDNYCSSCGQKADTHRITLKNFLFHDVLHGIFHLEKGILFTIKQALIRPGKAALDYIAGKRKPYYNVFLLILLTIGLMLFLRHYYTEILIEQGRYYVKDLSNLNEASRKIDNIFSQKSKIVIFLFIPFAAINSNILFRRKNLNLSEHSIIAGMVLLGILLFATLDTVIFYLDLFTTFTEQVANTIHMSVTTIVFLYIIFSYYNAFGEDYSILGFAFRILLFFAFMFVEMFILLVLAIGYVTHWKFGEIVVSPFG